MSLLKAEKILLTLIKAGIYLALLTPVAFLPFTVFPFTFGKVIYFQIIIGLLLPFWVMLILIAPRFRVLGNQGIFGKRINPPYSPFSKGGKRGICSFSKNLTPKNLIFTFLLFYFFILLITSFTGVDWRKSFWGYDERMTGVFSLLHYLVFFLILVSVFRSRKEWRGLLFFSLIVSLFLSIWGTIEYFYPSFGRGARGDSGEVMATFGNPIFFAGYLLFGIFIALWFCRSFVSTFRVDAKLRQTLFFGGAALFQIIVLGFTESRGAALGLATGIFVFLCFYVFKNRGRAKKVLLVALLVMFLFGAGAWLFRESSAIKKFPVIGQLVSISFETTTAKQRLLLWQAAYKGWKEKPFLGWGPENFDYVFDKYYNPQFLRYSLHETWGDRSHNAFLDILTAAGIAGFGIYLLFFGGLFRVLLRRTDNHGFKTDNHGLKRSDTHGLNSWKSASIILGLLIAYLVQNFFAFDTPGVLLMFFLVLAFIKTDNHGLKTDNHGLNQWKSVAENPWKSAAKNNQWKSSPVIVGGLVLLLSLASIYYLNLRPTLASANYIRAQKLGLAEWNKKRVLNEKALEFSHPYIDSVRLRFANQSFLEASYEETPKEYIAWSLRRAAEEIKKSQDRHPYDFSYPFTLGNLYTQLGIEIDPLHFKTAEGYYKKALELSPKRQATYFQFASLKLLENKIPEAVDLLKEAVSFDSEVGESHWRLGLALANNDQIEEAYQELKTATNLRFNSKIVRELKSAAAVFLLKQDYSGVVKFYEAAIELEPNTADHYAKLTVAYAISGDIEKAKKTLEKAVTLDPALEQEAKLFLEQLE